MRECSKNKRGNRSLSGFTLIEMLISMVILVIGLVGVLLVIPLAQRTTGRSAVATRAFILASEKIEELKAKGYTELTSQPEWSGVEEIFNWKATIADVDAGDFQGGVSLPSANFAKITLEVTYKSQGKLKTEEVTTFYSEL